MEKHSVYLAIPGRQFCWGTVTGVINSTAKHTVLPFNGGLGFSGVIDFNICLTDAINCYEAGKVTHFAMLHGDLQPDPQQRWLDMLLDVMDEKGAELVSAPSPIKDHRGITSSGIGDPRNPWGAFRRFTQQEILENLPRVFNAELAGYKGWPLLHNTGCWVADLRKDVFRRTNPDGTLATMFRFPERIVRDHKGLWCHEQESEDWLLSRELWQAGAKNTWITSEVKLTHFGAMSWPNDKPFGQFKNGDENTANRWRVELESRPLSLVQMLQFELGGRCNLADVHPRCPASLPNRYSALDTARELDDDTIVATATRAYLELGFDGLVGFAYYNEPTMQSARMFRIMERIKAAAPKARFILWANGTLIPEDCEAYRAFAQIIVSNYGPESQRGIDRLTAAKIDHRQIEEAKFDDRLTQIDAADASTPCLRPFVEFVIDNNGNTHLCCYDWAGGASSGNIFTEDFGVIAKRWRESLKEIVGDKMTEAAPAACRKCGRRWDKYQTHDELIVERARRFRESLRAPGVPAAASPACTSGGPG